MKILKKGSPMPNLSKLKWRGECSLCGCKAEADGNDIVKRWGPNYWDTSEAELECPNKNCKGSIEFKEYHGT